MKRRRRRLRGGFTLVELVATMTVLGTIAAVASRVLFICVDGYVGASVAGQLQSEMSVGLTRLVEEVREVPLDASASGTAPDITSVTATSLTWQTDRRVYLAGSTLQYEESGGSGALLLADVTGWTVEAYDESGVALALPLSGDACDAVRRVVFEVELTRYGETRRLRGSAFIRAMMAGA